MDGAGTSCATPANKTFLNTKSAFRGLVQAVNGHLELIMKYACDGPAIVLMRIIGVVRRPVNHANGIIEIGVAKERRIVPGVEAWPH